MKTILNRTQRGRDNIKPRQIYAEKIKQNQRKDKIKYRFRDKGKFKHIKIMTIKYRYND